MNREYQMELVEKYIEKTATDEEVKEFEKLMREDEALKEFYLRMKSHIISIQNVARKEMLNELKSIEEKLPELKLEKPTRRVRWIGWTIAAAACVAGMIWTIGFLIPDRATKYDRIYLSYYEPYRNLVTAYNRSGDSAVTIKEQALNNYTQGDYNKAIEKLQHIKYSDQDAVIHFYLANAYMATGKMKEAQDNFLKVLSGDTLFIDQTKWFLALSYMKSNKLNETREFLSELTNHENAYKTKAKEMLNIINSNQ
jgi:tetratricopeptide (TPR) repeat protein